MKLLSVTLNDIRSFTSPVRIGGIGPGLNVLCAPNENGKSTLFDALHAVFFTPHRSTAKEIKTLRPHAGGAPEVAVEIETGDGRFRIVKRWFTREMAEVWHADRLLAKADEAEAWIARLTTSGGEGGPAGLLWVRQGATQFHHKALPTGKDLTLSTRRDLMSSVTGEVEALTGGRRMDAALARARADLGVMLTDKGKAKAGGPLAKAEAEVASLTQRQTELTEITRRLADALQLRAQVRRSLAELQDPAAETDRRTRAAEAHGALDAANRHAEALAQADQAVRMARLEVNEAAGKLAALAQARDAEATARKAAADLHALAEAARASLAQADAAAQSRLVVVEETRTDRTAADTVLRAALRTEAARGEAARRADLTARLATLAALSADLAARRQAAATGPDAKAIAALEKQFQEVSVLRSLRASAATRISITYSGAQRITLSGTDLPAGTPHPIVTETDLHLPGIGDLSIHPGATSDTAARLHKAEADLAARLADLDCATLEQARLAAQARAEASAAVKDIETRIATLAPAGPAALEAELNRLPPAPEDATPTPLPEAQARFESAAQALQTAEHAANDARTLAETERLTHARAAVAAETAATTLQTARTALAGFGDLTVAEAQLSATRDDANRALADAVTRHATLAANAPDLAQAKAAASRAASVVRAAEQEIATLSETRAGLDREIDLRSGEGVAEDLADVTTRLAAAADRRDRLLFETAVLKDLIAALETARGTARERYFAPVMAELKPLLRLLWPDAELRFDGESLLPTALIRNGQVEDIGILSGGTQEQIALFVRLAFARLLARTGRHAPVILDDALVYTDDDRIERVFDLLHAQADDLQIIVLTCRQRAFRALGGQKLTFAPAPALTP